MKARYLEQFESIDTYIVETDGAITYHQKIRGGAGPVFRSVERTTGGGELSMDGGSVARALLSQFDRLARHSRYDGRAPMDGTPSHVLVVDTPALIDTSMGPWGR